MCEMVINHSSRPVNVNAKNHDGVTPLHMAALYNSESCTMLLKYDADVNIRNKKHEMAVDLTRKHRYPHIQVLLQDNKVYSEGKTQNP